MAAWRRTWSARQWRQGLRQPSRRARAACLECGAGGRHREAAIEARAGSMPGMRRWQWRGSRQPSRRVRLAGGCPLHCRHHRQEVALTGVDADGPVH
eukprot:349620-Chlamydomonas_euryale.AAC.7